jgi:hypothetical protein
MVSVIDPVAGTHVSWIVPGRQATVMSTHPQPRPTDCTPTLQARPAQNPHPTSTSEDLGVEEIQGVEARGRKVTTTTAAGTDGNSDPLVSTHETWTATSIRPVTLVVREIDDEPVNGKTTRELTGITLSEPDASVFEPPQGYDTVTKDPPPLACPAN